MVTVTSAYSTLYLGSQTRWVLKFKDRETMIEFFASFSGKLEISIFPAMSLECAYAKLPLKIALKGEPEARKLFKRLEKEGAVTVQEEFIPERTRLRTKELPEFGKFMDELRERRREKHLKGRVV